MIIIGANFCHVIRIMPLTHLIFSITLGNQKWNGAAPSFNINVNIINLIGILKLNNVVFMLNIILFIIIKRIIENSRRVDAKAWVKK